MFPAWRMYNRRYKSTPYVWSMGSKVGRVSSPPFPPGNLSPPAAFTKGSPFPRRRGRVRTDLILAPAHAALRGRGRPGSSGRKPPGTGRSTPRWPRCLPGHPGAKTTCLWIYLYPSTATPVQPPLGCSAAAVPGVGIGAAEGVREDEMCASHFEMSTVCFSFQVYNLACCERLYH